MVAFELQWDPDTRSLCSAFSNKCCRAGDSSRHRPTRSLRYCCRHHKKSRLSTPAHHMDLGLLLSCPLTPHWDPNTGNRCSMRPTFHWCVVGSSLRRPSHMQGCCSYHCNNCRPLHLGRDTGLDPGIGTLNIGRPSRCCHCIFLSTFGRPIFCVI